jgi:hypothetical protein
MDQNIYNNRNIGPQLVIIPGVYVYLNFHISDGKCSRPYLLIQLITIKKRMLNSLWCQNVRTGHDMY